MNGHPGIVFRAGPTGQRAALAAGPDVWEVVRAAKSARSAEPKLAEDDMLELLSANSGVSVQSLRFAIQYWASYPEEIDSEIAAADAAEGTAEET